MSGKFVLYYRVSTQRQGQSGLGLEAQQQPAMQYLQQVNGHMIQEFVEVESGRKANRPELEKAIDLCRAYNATLLVAKFDRLSRDAHFLLGLQKAGIKFIAADNPQANELTLGILALVAQQEAKAISERTKAALAAAKARGLKLGGDRGYRGNKDDLVTATEAKKAKADETAKLLEPILNRVNPDGKLSFKKVAQVLNMEGVTTLSGKGKWYPSTVKNVYHRLAA
jgi:DNA invertase Pin-like site-specific DNA recombinase